MIVIYNLGIWVYVGLIKLVAFANPKAKQWVKGRRNIFQNIQNTVHTEAPIAWFHVSSLGEFEQGRPVMEAFKAKYPAYKILLTFFSPSGYEIRKNYADADYIFYLPADTPRNARRFIQIVNPTVAFFVKYEFWFHYLNQLNKKGVPTYIFSAIFRSDQLFFKWYGKWYRNMLRFFSIIYVQDEASKTLLQQIGIPHVVVGGDTRFDRVTELAQKSKSFPLIEQFSAGQKVVVAGSTWENDEELIARYLVHQPTVKWIVAPHEIHSSHLQKIKNLFQQKALFFSEANEQNIQHCQVLVIDSIGMLSSIYKYGGVAYIGGGFGKGIHNTLEAATYGIPVVFGPNYQRFKEAVDLIHQGAGFSIHDEQSFNQTVDSLWMDDLLREKAGRASRLYVDSMQGGTQKILSDINKIL
jgi:3-deoxy-D-manno-octulosonic-acid transferase